MSQPIIIVFWTGQLSAAGHLPLPEELRLDLVSNLPKLPNLSHYNDKSTHHFSGTVIASKEALACFPAFMSMVMLYNVV